ncbi:hypothetical protein [Treponema sp.]|uniref:hypothetical protein n=1 Tax=Treponema sp. TaxID=166 RepID=UPI00298E975B|nr:hypothetical protein [Treponema sp.]
MKKIVGTIAAIALAASSAFAGANFGMGFNRAFFTPFAYDGKAKADISTSWGNAPRIGASFSAASEDVGVVADVKFDGGGVAVNDNAYIWVKPASWLKVQIGQSFDDTLRGNACFGTWDWLRPGNILGEDLTFTRICENPLAGAYQPLAGAIVMLDPIEGLHIAAGLKIGTAGSDNNYTLINAYQPQTWEYIAKNLQAQVGYTIPGIMQIKAQYIGKGDDKQVINAAVSVKAVENMTLDAGVFFDTADKAPVTVGLFWGMPFGAVNANVNAQIVIPTAENGETKVAAGAGIGVDLGNGLSCGADVRYAQKFQKDVNNDPEIAFAAWLDKGIANGTLGVAVQGAMKTAIRDFKASDFTVAVPVRVQCFF